MHSAPAPLEGNMSQGCHTRAKPFASALAGKLSSSAEAVLHFCKHDPASFLCILAVPTLCAYIMCTSALAKGMHSCCAWYMNIASALVKGMHWSHLNSCRVHSPIQLYVLVTGIRQPKAAVAYPTQQPLYQQLWRYLWGD